MDIFSTLQWTINTVHITGNPMFDYFFTLMLFFGLLGFALGILARLLSRS